MQRILQTASRQAAEAAFRPVAPLRTAGRATLMLGTALGCSIAILAAPDRALADNECGAPVAGVVTTCAAPTYGTGIRYDSLPGEDLTVVIEEDVAVIGAVAVNGTNAITVRAETGSTITTADQYADGIVANSTDGDVSVASANIATTGALFNLRKGAERPVVERQGALIMVDDARMRLLPGEAAQLRMVRFRTLGCYPLTGAVESEADTLDAVIVEMRAAFTSERQGRLIDAAGAASLEAKKREGYF